MKKIIISLLCMCMLFSSVVMAENAVATENGFDMEVVTGLGILDNNYKTSPQTEITREEFVDILVKIINKNEVDGEVVFTDVKGYDSYSTKVRYAAEMGYVNGYGDGTFKPKNTITPQEAAVIILKVAGYDMMAQNSGGTFQDYVNLAHSNDLFDGMTGKLSGALTAGQTARLLYNTLDLPVVLAEYTSAGTEWKLSKDTTFMNKFLKVYRVRGLITATPESGLSEKGGCSEGSVGIGDEVYECGYEEAYNYLGYGTENYIYSFRSDEYLVLSVPYKTNVTMILSKDVLTGKSTSGYVHYDTENNKTKKIKIDSVVDILVNGVSAPEYSVKDAISLDGEIFFIDNDDDNDVDVISVYSYEVVFVETVSEYDEKIYNKYSYPGAVGEYDLEKAIVSITENGAVKAFSDIEKNDILMIKSSEVNGDKKYEIEIVSKKIEGNITSVRKDENKVFIDGVEYYISKTYLDAVKGRDRYAKELSNGMFGVFYLDKFGKIAAFESVSTSYKYGVVKRTYHLDDDEGGNIKVKVFGDDGDWYTYEFTDKVRVNSGSVSKEKLLAQPELSSDKYVLTVQLVRYKLNKDGKINNLETAVETTDENVDFRVRNVRQMPYRQANASFDSNVYIGKNTVVYDIPAMYTDETGMVKRYTDREIGTLDEMFFYDSASFKDWGIYDIKAYNCDRFGVAEFIVKESDISSMGEGNTGGFIFKESITSINSNNEPETVLKGVHGMNIAASVSLRSDCVVKDTDGTKISADDIKMGDLLTLYYDIEGKVHNISIVYRASTAGGYSKYTASLHEDSFKLYGRIVDVDAENGMLLLDDGVRAADGSEVYKRIKVDPSKVSIHFCREDDVEIGNISMLKRGDYFYTSGWQSSFGSIVIYDVNE